MGNYFPCVLPLVEYCVGSGSPEGSEVYQLEAAATCGHLWEVSLLTQATEQ